MSAENHDTRGVAKASGARVGVAESNRFAVGIGMAVCERCLVRGIPNGGCAGRHIPYPPAASAFQ
jgi:hypothetical protein